MGTRTGAARRGGSLPSLAELGAFDRPPVPTRLPGRLTDEDLRGLPARPAGPDHPARRLPEAATRAVTRSAGSAASGAAAAKPVSWPGLKPDAVARATALSPLAPEAGAAPTKPPTPSSMAPAEPNEASPSTKSPEPSAAGPAPRMRTVPGVTVGWADLQAAVAAGWIKPEAAHLIWARWLARKPLSHMEVPEGAEADSPPAAPAGPEAASGPASGAGPELSVAPVGGPADTGSQEARAASVAASAEARSDGAAPGVGASPRAASHPEPEVLEPLHEARTRRSAGMADLRPRIEVVDVIEVPAPERIRPAGPAAISLQVAAALLAAVAAAFCVGVGSVVFGPWGGVAAAVGCTALAWGYTSRLRQRGQVGAALFGAHLVLPLLAATIWQLQTALGWWPAERPLDLFADVPGAGVAAVEVRLDWRWLALAGGPLLAAVFWLVRLRHPALLGAVTLLLWGVAYQAVAGVLQSLGLAFHGMSTFTLLLGALTLAAALYVDLRVRRAGVADFARWPYLGGALLLGVGWVSLAVLPGWVLLPRYLGWVLFLLWALSLQRVAMVGVALALAGFELAWSAARVSGSNLLGLVLWTVWLAGAGGAVNFLWPRRQAWSAPLRSWMPRAWREVFAPAATPGSGEGAAAAPRAGVSKARA